MLLRSPAVSACHARLGPEGSRWRLAAEAGGDVWVAGERITNVPLTGPVTALLGTRDEAGIPLTQLVRGPTAPAQITGPTPSLATGPTSPSAGYQATGSAASGTAGSGHTITGRSRRGLDLALLAALPDGTAVTVPTGGLPQASATGATGCFAINLTASELGQAALPSGTYHIQLYGGPNLTPIGQPAAVTVNGAG